MRELQTVVIDVLGVSLSSCGFTQLIDQGACCTNGWSMDHFINIGAIHRLAFCSCWSTPSFLDRSETLTQGSIVTMTFVDIFQVGCRTKS